ncbi:MAG: hypothetical protein ACHREM_02215 [Polyangiales bacterium]
MARPSYVAFGLIVGGSILAFAVKKAIAGPKPAAAPRVKVIALLGGAAVVAPVGAVVKIDNPRGGDENWAEPLPSTSDATVLGLAEPSSYFHTYYIAKRPGVATVTGNYVDAAGKHVTAAVQVAVR